jgi:hypothetical protein
MNAIRLQILYSLAFAPAQGKRERAVRAGGEEKCRCEVQQTL